jgi:hypothetical protein
MAVGDQDLAIFFQDGTPGVLADGTTIMGHFDMPEQLEGFAPVNVMAKEVAGRTTFRYATSSAPSGFGHNSTITIKGVTYRVRSPRKVGDGQESIVDLAIN